MKATVWAGRNSVKVSTVPDPKILNDRDAIVRVTSTAICGSDLHLYDGYIPTVKHGDVLGHEFMGEVVEVGKAVKNLALGDRVVVPFTISCGACSACERGLFSLCENSNPNAGIVEKLMGYSPAGLFGYSHMMGVRRRASGVCPRAVRRRRTAEDRGRQPYRRSGAVLVRRLPDRLHGRRHVQHHPG